MSFVRKRALILLALCLVVVVGEVQASGDGEQVLSEAASVLKAYLLRHADEVSVTPMPLSERVRHRLVEARWSVSLPASPALSPRMKVTLRGSDANGDWAESLWFEVRAYRQAWVALRPLNTRDRVSEDTVGRRRIDLTKAVGELFEGDVLPENHWVTRRLHEGDPLTVRSIAPRPDVVSRHPVVVNVRANGVRLSVAGTAMQSGFLGERVLVRPTGVGAEDNVIRGVVTAPATVTLARE